MLWRYRIAQAARERRNLMVSGLCSFALAFLLGGLSGQVAGAEPAPARASLSSDLERLTLRQAEIFFAARNRELRLAQQMLQGAEADRISASARPNPTVSLSATQIGNTYPQGYDSGRLDRRADLTLGINQTIERGDKRLLRMEAADFNIRATRGDYADIQRQQKVALQGAYFDLVAAQEKLRIASETAGSFQKTLDAVELRLKAGDIASADVARIHVDALRAQNDARAAQAERQKAQSALAYIIGAERNAAQINAVDSWPSTSEAAAFDLEQALAGRADVQAALARVQQAEKNRDLARALRTRDVTAGVQVDRTPWNPLANPTSQNTVGFSVSMPLFTNYYFEGEIRRAEVDLQSARENLERVRALALSEIARSRADLDAARERAARFRDLLLKEAQRAADAAEFAYTRGAIGVMDLLDARRQLYATRLDASATQADYAKSLAAWEAAIAVVQIEQQ